MKKLRIVSVFVYALEETSVDLLLFSKCEKCMNVFFVIHFLVLRNTEFSYYFCSCIFIPLPHNNNGKQIILLFELTMVEMVKKKKFKAEDSIKLE